MSHDDAWRVIPTRLPETNLAEFLWADLPTPWQREGGEAERALHEGLLSGVQTAVDTVNGAGLALHPQTAAANALPWLAFILGVPSEVAEMIPEGALRVLLPVNRALLKRRSTDDAFFKLQHAWMPGFDSFSELHPWRMDTSSRQRFTRGGVWSVEVEANSGTPNAYRQMYQVWSYAYTSARYTLVLAAQHAVSSLNLRWDRSGRFDSEYRPTRGYLVDDAVWHQGQLWRKLVSSPAGIAPGTAGRIWQREDAATSYAPPHNQRRELGVYDARTSYRRGDVVSHAGSRYVSVGDGVIGKAPDLAFSLWGRVTASPGRDFNPVVRAPTFITSQPHTNVIGVENTGSGVQVVLGGVTQDTAASLGTSWRLPNGLIDDPGARFIPVPFYRRDILHGLVVNYVTLNQPAVKSTGEFSYSLSGPGAPLNVSTMRWANLIEENLTPSS